MISPIIEKQSRFMLMTAHLIIHAQVGLGYYTTYGEAWRLPDSRHGHARSLHKSRLALDVNLFTDEKGYLRNTSDHLRLGEFWESIGGTWGGRFDDGNHYSLEHGGMK